MIQAQELRLGNWVNPHFQTTNFNAKVQGISLDSLHRQHFIQVSCDDNLEGYSENNIDPIILSTQLLEKAGFKKWKELHFRQWGWVCKNVIVEVNEDGEIVYMHEPNIIVELKYLHQLQNLFYFLTGEELIIENV